MQLIAASCTRQHLRRPPLVTVSAKMTVRMFQPVAHAQVGGEWLSTGNYTYRGFEMCIAVRKGQYKWIGLNGKVYK
jgi:hypothetical protein